jgi:hypothetical protein
MAIPVYILCTLTSLACAVMLMRAYAQSRQRFLLWAGLCFVAFVLNNALLYLDAMVGPSLDLSVPRGATALAGVGVLVFGLVWEEQR